jgi:hypothetical protein
LLARGEDDASADAEIVIQSERFEPARAECDACTACRQRHRIRRTRCRRRAFVLDARALLDDPSAIIEQLHVEVKVSSGQ